MITDDPATPGSGTWEINVSTIFERAGGERTWEAPALDVNYGLGDHLQLKLETSFVVSEKGGRGPIGGIGNAVGGVKWRFVDQEKAGISVSTYPQIEWSLNEASVRRELADGGTHLLLPIEFAREFGKLTLVAELGDAIDFAGENECFYGFLAAVEITEKWELMAEVHGVSTFNGHGDQLALNAGARRHLSEHLTVLAAVGHDVRAADGESLRLIAFLGLQVTF